MPMTLWRRRRSEDLRPTWEQRQAALESVRSRLRRQGASARRRAWVWRLTPGAVLLAFFAGTLSAGPLLRVAIETIPAAFQVRRLELLGAERFDTAEIAGIVARSGGVPELITRVTRHPWVAEARAVRVTPGTVVVRIVERMPAAIWRNESGDALLVDAQGTPFAVANGEALPHLVLRNPVARGVAAYPCRPLRGCAPDPRLAAGVALARRIESSGFPEPQILLDASDPHAAPVLHLPGVAPRVLLGDGDPAPALANLARVLAAIPASHGAGEIDLRFAGQVVLRPVVPEPGEDSEASPEATPQTPETGSRAG
jgi:hypothetical protein